VVRYYTLIEGCGRAKLLTSWCLEEGREMGRGQGSRYSLLEHTVRNLLPSTRYYLLKFLPTPNIEIVIHEVRALMVVSSYKSPTSELLPWEPSLQHESLGGHFISKP
jgi:hypothetical protein